MIAKEERLYIHIINWITIPISGLNELHPMANRKTTVRGQINFISFRFVLFFSILFKICLPNLCIFLNLLLAFRIYNEKRNSDWETGREIGERVTRL